MVAIMKNMEKHGGPFPPAMIELLFEKLASKRKPSKLPC